MEAIKRIENLLKMEEDRPQRDAAGVCIPANGDAAIRRKILEQCLKILADENKNAPTIL